MLWPPLAARDARDDIWTGRFRRQGGGRLRAPRLDGFSPQAL